MGVYESSVVLPKPRVEVFEYLRRPDNLLKMFPTQSKDKLSLKAPDIINPGDKIEFSFKAIGQNFSFVHEIVDVTFHDRIRLNQVHGPLKLWATEQIFSDSDATNTLLKTVVRFEPPSGLLGFLLTKKTMHDYLKHWVPVGQELLRKTLSTTDT